MISDPQERSWGMACHLAALAGLVTGVGFVLGPLVVWLVKRDQSAFVNDQGKEALNFQISFFVYSLAAILPAFTLILIPVTILLLGAIHVLNIVLIIVAAVGANSGQYFRYPANLRFIR